MKPLDDMITYGFLPTLFGSALTETERKIVALPVRLGGMGISILKLKADDHFKASKFITAETVRKINTQDRSIPTPNSDKIRLVRVNTNLRSKEDLEELKKVISPHVKRCMDMMGEKGSSNWLLALPAKDRRMVLNRGEFTDAINLRYYRELRGLPAMCACSQKFSITHALNCKRGGFVHMRHDGMRDFIAGLLNIVQNDVQIEPPLQEVRTDNPQNMGNTAEAARLDIRAKGFWRNGQDSYFDVRITNPLSATAMKCTPSSMYDKHEKEKKRMYNHRVMSIEKGTFTPLVFSVFGTSAPECKIFLKNLFQKIADKRKENYGDVANWARCRMSFLSLKSTLMCLRGTRSTTSNFVMSEDFRTDNIENGLL